MDNSVVVDDELVADVESAFAAAPVVEDAPKAEEDLARIEGIGPKIAAALKAAGITTFAALADAERSTLEERSPTPTCGSPRASARGAGRPGCSPTARKKSSRR